MARADETYAYAIIRQAELQSAAEATNPNARRRHLQVASFATRSARLLGAVA
jgi:hypothetical protein